MQNFGLGVEKYGRMCLECCMKKIRKSRSRRRKFRLRNIFAKIHQSWFVVAVCVGVVVGTILGLVFRIKYFNSGIWAVAAGLVLVVGYFQSRKFLLVFAVISGIVFSLVRCSAELSGEDYIKQFVGRTITVAGTIDGDPETDGKGTKFKLRDLKLAVNLGNGKSEEGSGKVAEENEGEKVGENDGKSVEGNLYVSVSRNEELARGDQVVLNGKMSEGFGTYAGYLYKPKIVNWARPSPGDLAVEVRDWFAERVRKTMESGGNWKFGDAAENEVGKEDGTKEKNEANEKGERDGKNGIDDAANVAVDKEVSLGISYLLGMKTGLDEGLEENLRTIGLTHIVVASGAHLAILVEIARKIFGRASKFVGAGASMMFIVFFMALVGWTPSIMRAGIMSILKLVAETVGREFAAWRIILIVASGTLLINPMYIINLGWLLSFASFAGIMILGPWLAKFLYGEREPKFIANTVLMTVSATLMTLPITLYYFGTVSLIAILPNMLILPTLPYAMGAVFLAGLTSGAAFLETVMGFLTTKILTFHIGVVEFFGQMKSFLVEMPTEQMGVFGIYGIFLAIAAFAWGLNRKKKRRNVEEVLLE